MGVKLFLSDYADAAADAAIRESGLRGHRRSFVIVPDRLTLAAEARVLELLKLSGSADIEALSFSRLARKLTPDSCKIMTPEAGVMLMKRIVNEKRPQLKALGAASAGVGFARDIYAVIADLRNNRITPDDLKKVADNGGALKSADISLLYAEYIKRLDAGYRDAGGLLESFVAAIEEDETLLGSDVCIFGFSEFSKLQLDVIEKLALRCDRVAVALAVKNEGANKRVYCNETAFKVEKRADRAGVSCEKAYIQSRLTPEKRALEQNLFGYSGGKYFGNTDWFESYYASDKEEEIEYVARAVKRSVVEEGLRYKDSAIVAGSLEGYESVIARCFADYGIPYYLDERTPLSGTPPVRLLLAALETAAKGKRAKESLAFLKESFLGADRNKVFDFENYSLKYNIDRTRFERPFEIADERYDAGALEEIRRLLCLTDIFSGKKTVSGFCDAIENFYKEADFDAALARCAERQRELGFEAAADALLQTPEKIGRLLDALREMLGDVETDAAGFSGYFASACESVEISSIPLFLDSVFIGDADAGHYGNIKRLYVIGATEGRLPVEESAEGIIGLKETRAWAKLGVIIEPDAKKRLAIKKFALLDLFLKPSEKLVITAPVSGDGKRLSPSFALLQTEKIFGKSAAHISALIDDGDADGFFVRCAGGGKAAVKLFADWLSRAKENIFENEREADVLRVLAGDGPLEEDSPAQFAEGLADIAFRRENGKLYTSVSQLEKYFKCPYFHFVEKGLKLKERELPDIKAADLGTFLHEVLERFFSRQKDFDRSREFFEKKAEQIFFEILGKKEYAFLTETSQNRAVCEILKEEATHMLVELSCRMKHTKLLPFMEEAEFGAGEFGEIALALADGSKLYMTGKIDRIDKMDDYVAIVDYKSKKGSSVKFGLSEIYRGERIQLFTYLGAVLKRGYRPAGAFYLPLAGGYERTAGEKYAYKGFIVDDAEAFRKFDDTVAENGKSLLFPAELKDGKVKGAGALSREDFGRIISYVEKLEAVAAEEIRGGYAAASPVSGACRYCGYADICAKDRFGDAERKSGRISLDDFGAEDD